VQPGLYVDFAQKTVQSIEIALHGPAHLDQVRPPA